MTVRFQSLAEQNIWNPYSKTVHERMLSSRCVVLERVNLRTGGCVETMIFRKSMPLVESRVRLKHGRLLAGGLGRDSGLGWTGTPKLDRMRRWGGAPSPTK